VSCLWLCVLVSLLRCSRPTCPPVALAALSRQLVLLSKDISVLDARAEDHADEPAIPDEPFSGDAV
jgi:hypothetical protein